VLDILVVREKVGVNVNGHEGNTDDLECTRVFGGENAVMASAYYGDWSYVSGDPSLCRHYAVICRHYGFSQTFFAAFCENKGYAMQAELGAMRRSSLASTAGDFGHRRKAVTFFSTRVMSWASSSARVPDQSFNCHDKLIALAGVGLFIWHGRLCAVHPAALTREKLAETGGSWQKKCPLMVRSLAVSAWDTDNSAEVNRGGPVKVCQTLVLHDQMSSCARRGAARRPFPRRSVGTRKEMGVVGGSLVNRRDRRPHVV